MTLNNRLLLLFIIFIVSFFGCGETQTLRIKREEPFAKPEVTKKEKEAKAEYEKKDEEDYVVEYQNAADLFYSAKKAYKNGDYDTAFILFDQIVKQYPEDVIVEDSIMYQARALFSKGFFEHAKDKYKELLATFPNSRFEEECRYYLYLAYRELNDRENAVKIRGEFVKLYPESKHIPRLILETADDQFNDRDYYNALDNYLKYYKISESEETQKVAYDNAMDIIQNIFTIDELLSIQDTYSDKFPAAYIKYEIAKAYLSLRKVDDAKFLFLEIEEFFPMFEKLDEIHKYLSKIEKRVLTNPDVVACLLPLSGKYAAYGQRLLAGIMLAADIFSQDENSHPITILVKDTKGDENIALKMLDEAYNDDKAIAVIGPLLSKSSEECAKRAEELGIPIMLLTQKEDVLKNYGYVYRKFLTNSRQVDSLVDYAANYKKLNRFAIIYPENSYGNELKNIFFDKVINHGAQVVAAESYDTTKSDFADEIKKLVGLSDLVERKRLRKLDVEDIITEEKLDMQYMITNGKLTAEQVDAYLAELRKELMNADYEPIVDFEAIFVPDSYNRAGLIIPQLLYHDIDKDVLKLGPSTYNSKKLIEIAQDNSDGIVFVDGFFKESADPDVVAFTNLYKEIFDTDPTLLEAEAYDSTKIIIGLIRDEGIEDRDDLKDALDNIKDYKGVTGVLRKFVNGEADEDLLLLTIKRGNITQIVIEKRAESDSVIPFVAPTDNVQN